MEREYYSAQDYYTVPNATRVIVNKYNLSRHMESKVYREILRLAKVGEFRSRKYNNEASRVWEIGVEVIEYIEKKFNLVENIIKEDKPVVAEKNTIEAIEDLIKWYKKNIIDENTFFELLDSLLKNK